MFYWRYYMILITTFENSSLSIKNNIWTTAIPADTSEGLLTQFEVHLPLIMIISLV